MTCTHSDDYVYQYVCHAHDYESTHAVNQTKLFALCFSLCLVNMHAWTHGHARVYALSASRGTGKNKFHQTGTRIQKATYLFNRNNLSLPCSPAPASAPGFSLPSAAALFALAAASAFSCSRRALPSSPRICFSSFPLAFRSCDGFCFSCIK
jgi:hypothetical protein